MRTAGAVISRHVAALKPAAPAVLAFFLLIACGSAANKGGDGEHDSLASDVFVVDVDAVGPLANDSSDVEPEDTSAVADGAAVSDADVTVTDLTGADSESETWSSHAILVVLNWDQRDAPLGAGKGKYRYIVMQDYMFERLPAVREANPNARILAYQNIGAMRSDGGDHPSSGVKVQEAEAGNESFFLHDNDGNRIKFCDYSQLHAANVGDSAYQERWLGNVRSRVVVDGFDGVYLDDVNTFPGHCLGSAGTPIKEYPTDNAYGDAMVSFMHRVGPALKAAGLLVVPNVAVNPWNADQRDRALAILPDVTHFFWEFWMRWLDSGNFTNPNWVPTMQLMSAVESAGVPFLTITYGPGAEGAVAGQRYGCASWLLAWNGVLASAWGYFDAAVADPWAESWCGDIGAPVGKMLAEGSGYKRYFTGGVVLVNPESSGSQSFTLNATFYDSAGIGVTGITLAPGDAAILTRAP